MTKKDEVKKEVVVLNATEIEFEIWARIICKGIDCITYPIDFIAKTKTTTNNDVVFKDIQCEMSEQEIKNKFKDFYITKERKDVN